MSDWARFAGDLLVLASLTGMTVAVLGLIRMPDIYNRIHAAGQAVFLALLPLILAQFLTADGAIAARAGLLGVFLLLTTPVASHALARAAYQRQRREAQVREREKE